MSPKGAFNPLQLFQASGILDGDAITAAWLHLTMIPTNARWSFLIVVFQPKRKPHSP
jgi:hypothetical protein